MHHTLNILLAALSFVESNNRDFVRGKSGEVSRYQIMPYIWKTESSSTSYGDPEIARDVAARILSKRIDHYVKKMGRLPNAAEVYALWNKPGAFEAAGFNLHKLHRRTIERCQRYAARVEILLYEKQPQLALDTTNPMRQK